MITGLNSRTFRRRPALINIRYNNECDPTILPRNSGTGRLVGTSPSEEAYVVLIDSFEWSNYTFESRSTHGKLRSMPSYLPRLTDQWDGLVASILGLSVLNQLQRDGLLGLSLILRLTLSNQAKLFQAVATS